MSENISEDQVTLPAPDQSTQPGRFREWVRKYRVELLLFLLLFGTDVYFYQSTQHNEASRLDQTRAIIQDHTLLINKYWWNTADVIHIQREGKDHIYPAKAPGMSLAAIVPYAFWLIFLKLFTALGMPEWVYWHLVTYLTVLSTVGLFSAIAAVATYRLLLGATNDSYLSVFVVLAIWLGTLAFPFSTILFSHQFVAALVALGFYFLFQLRSPDTPSVRRSFVAALASGFLFGFAVATEYPVGIIIPLFGLYFLWKALHWKLPLQDKAKIFGCWIAGGAIGGLILVTYNVLAFGQPFYIAYEALTKPNSPFPTHTHGWIGFALPDWHHFCHAVASFMVFPPVGLLYLKIENWRIYACNPVLWLTLPGLAVILWRRAWRAEALLIMAMTLAYLVFISSYGTSIYDWAGATYIGPRHIIPLLPLLALPMYFGARYLRVLFYPLLAISVFYMLLVAAIEPRVPNPFENPQRDFLIPDYLRGKFAENTFNMFDGYSHLLTRDSTAFNLPKLLGAPGRYQLAPLMLWWVVAGSLLLCSASKEGAEERRVRYWPRAASAGLLLFTGAIALAPVVHYARAYSLDVHHGLLGKYYRNATWSGEPVDMQVDPQIDFDWSKSFPLPAPFSVEWTGQLVVDTPGDYIFTVIADDGVILQIDGRTVVDASHDAVLQERTGGINLAVGMHPIRVRYLNNLFGGSVRVWWTMPGRPRAIVPSESLIPDPRLPVGHR